MRKYQSVKEHLIAGSLATVFGVTPAAMWAEATRLGELRSFGETEIRSEVVESYLPHPSHNETQEQVRFVGRAAVEITSTSAAPRVAASSIRAL